jgi:hypothetical protein
MSQFIDTEHANESFRQASEIYRLNREKIRRIRENILNRESPTNDDILWLCKIAEDGISSSESSWYDHG